MQNIPLAQSSTIVSVEKFWDSLLIYHDRPHLVNRKLLVCSQALFCKLDVDTRGLKNVCDLFSRSAILYEGRKLKNLDKQFITTNIIRNLVECYDKNLAINEVTVNDFKDAVSGVYVSVRILIPRRNSDKCLEMVILDKDKHTATFICASELQTAQIAPQFPYNIELSSSGNLRITVPSIEDADTASAEWLSDKLFSKLIKWAENDVNDTFIQSLSLIPPDEYSELYINLKEKYGKDLVQRWPSKTNTDPQKYIFEDFAIAAYLICLWRIYTEKEKISFVDCGCGNGLLVYVLTLEGYKGYGYDLRRRPTWDLYPKNVDLREMTLTPESTFSLSNWLIGNHSDELTPWLPVNALTSSPNTNFFLLPCCSYEFSGKKFIRRNTSLSQYNDYMNYIEDISNLCNFDTKIDKLRIPSTKRTCFVGIQKSYLNEQEWHDKIHVVNDFVKTKISDGYQSRVESNYPRNCTKLDFSLRERIVKRCVDKLLSKENFILKSNGDNWNKGIHFEVLDLLKSISEEDKKQLKNECGGLQTLLKNHRYIFEVAKGRVSLRQPQMLDECTKKYKDKHCWFVKNHPQGCLHDGDICANKH